MLQRFDFCRLLSVLAQEPDGNHIAQAKLPPPHGVRFAPTILNPSVPSVISIA